MKTLVAVFSLLLLTTISLKAQETIAGIWDTGRENTKIEIKSSNTAFEGKIFASNNAKATPGKLMVKDLVDQENQLFKGKLYIIRFEKWVDAEFIRVGDKLKIAVSNGFRKKNLEWNLVK